jgi:proteasome lid subunit RPN8/RPN11
MDPAEQIEAMFTIEEQGQQIIAIYHSHPSGPDHPSEIDLNQAAYPNTAHIIWYPSGEQWVSRAYLILDQGSDEIPIETRD